MSGSDSESNLSRSPSPIHHGSAPTPGHGLQRSPSNSPDRKDFRSCSKSPASRNGRSRSKSPTSRNGRSRSPSIGSNKSQSDEVNNSSRSSTPASRKSRSRSRSDASNRSVSNESNNIKDKDKSRSPSPNNNNKEGSVTSQDRSRSVTPHNSRDRSRSRSRSRSKSRSRSRSRSPSPNNNNKEGSVTSQDRSRSVTPHNSRDRSRSRSRSRSKSRSRSRSKSRDSNRSKSAESRSRSPSSNRSSSNSPNLQIDEPTSFEEKNENKEETDEKSTNKRKTEIDSDSDSENHVPKKHKTNDDEDDKKNEDMISDNEKSDGEKDIETSDNEKDKNENEEINAAAIFGDDVLSSEDEEKGKTEINGLQDNSDVERVGDEEEEKENEPEPIPETRIDVSIPKISCDLGRDIHFVKLPNFLSVETRPYDPETYEDEIDEEETLDEEGRARLKLKVENTIRWREQVDDEGNINKQSNARLVRWSDGSYSLHLGSEIFDVYKQPLQGDHNHLFIRQGTGLQGQAVYRTKLSFRPHSTESFTHRKMTLSLADRSQKTSGIKILSQVGLDPDHDRKTLLKKEEEKLKQTVRVSKPRKKDSSTRLHSSGSVYREEDGSDEEGAISLNAIKNKYKSGAAVTSKGGAIYSSDEEGSDIEARSARKMDKSKALKDSESSEDSE